MYIRSQSALINLSTWERSQYSIHMSITQKLALIGGWVSLILPTYRRQLHYYQLSQSGFLLVFGSSVELMPSFIYRAIMTLLFATGTKLLYDGFIGLN